MVLAATTQQAVALVVFLIVVVLWIAFLFTNSRKAKAEVGAELELAANRKPYLDDEQLEGPRLERALLWGVLALMVIGVGLPLYWITEPNRQDGAKKFYADRAAGVVFHHGQPLGGGALFSPTASGGFNCAGCHGGLSGIGGQVAYTLTDPETGKLRQVQWKAPALNVATLRYTDEQLTDILTYGRPFSPMPAWGIAGGGPMNDQQISNLIAYLHSIEIPKDQARKEAAAAAEKERQRLLDLGDSLAAAQAKVAAATTDADREAAEKEVSLIETELSYNAGQYPTVGQALFNLNCARCHTLGWSYDEPKAPGTGAYGPPLTNVDNQFPDPDDQIDFVTNGRKRGEKYGLNGQSAGRMPHFGIILTADQIKAIVNYERSIGSNG